jgi:hypothetical protein
MSAVRSNTASRVGRCRISSWTERELEVAGRGRSFFWAANSRPARDPVRLPSPALTGVGNNHIRKEPS